MGEFVKSSLRNVVAHYLGTKVKNVSKEEARAYHENLLTDFSDYYKGKIYHFNNLTYAVAPSTKDGEVFNYSIAICHPDEPKNKMRVGETIAVTRFFTGLRVFIRKEELKLLIPVFNPDHFNDLVENITEDNSWPYQEL